MFAYLTWNPNPVAFTLPIIHHPIVWYGLLFAMGFLVTYVVLKRIAHFEVAAQLPFSQKQINQFEKLKKVLQINSTQSDPSILEDIHEKLKSKSLKNRYLKPLYFRFSNLAQEFCDQMSLIIVSSLVIGARLGYVFFYGWPLYQNQWWKIFKVWEGGLASHGACFGILVAVVLLKKRMKKTPLRMSYLFLVDLLAVISGFFAFFIRLGNFMNQEIVGRVTQVPWAIIFLNPLDGNEIAARHPVQLYEAFFYLTLALTMYRLWRTNSFRLGSGAFSGLFLSSLFSFRFVIEFFKEPQGVVLPLFKGLTMGQYLSLPFIAIGIGLLIYYQKKGKQQYKPSQL